MNKTTYLGELERFLKEVKDSCERTQVDYVLVDTSRPVDVVLSAYLIQRLKILT